MKETKLDKGKTFDKIYAMMLVNCNKEVSEEQVNDVKTLTIFIFTIT